MGHGARGLQRARHRLGVPSARPRPLARLPLGRRRPRRLLRRRAATLPRARALERLRPDPEGADLRPHGQPGQPRRGRQGVLVVPRRHADPFVEPLALPLSAGGVPVRAARPGERGAGQARPRARAAGHGHLRRRPLLDRRGALRQGRCPRHPADDRGHERRSRGGDAARAPDRLVPQHVGLGDRRPRTGPPGRSGRSADRDGASVPRLPRDRRRRRARRPCPRAPLL